LGEAVAVPPARAPFFDEAGFGELALVADGVGFSKVWWEGARGGRVREVAGGCEADQRLVGGQDRLIARDLWRERGLSVVG
jgi:hypothetical protein